MVGVDSDRACGLSYAGPDDAIGEHILIVIDIGVALSPLAEREQNWLQLEPKVRHRVFNASRHLGEDRPLHQPMRLHIPKLLDQYLLGDVGYHPLQLGKPLRSVKDVIENDGLPSPRDDFQRPFYRQSGQPFQGFGHGHFPVGKARKGLYSQALV